MEEEKNITTENQNINISGKPKKKKINVRVIMIIIAVILCIGITVAFTVIKMIELKSEYTIVEENNVFSETPKKEDEDKKYIIDFGETIDYNDINIISYVDMDGTLYRADDANKPKEYQSTSYNYVEINGLKNKDVQNKINKKIKDTVYSFNEAGSYGKIYAYTNICGNFNNILSIEVHDNSNASSPYVGLNFDLNTGDQISFEDLFIKSAPVVSILSDAVNKAVAWNIDTSNIDYDSDPEEYMKYLENMRNMENRDTSEYEDILLKVANLYAEKKGNIKFNITPYKILVYDFSIEEMGEYPRTLQIEMYKYKDYIALFKRYLGQNLYEDNNVRMSGVKVFSEPYNSFSGCKENTSIYGELTNNSFFDIYYLNNYEYTPAQYLPSDKVLELSKVNLTNFIESKKRDYINDTSHGYAIQGGINYSTWEEPSYDYNTGRYRKPYISASLYYIQTKFSSEDFKNLDYYLAVAGCWPRASVDPVPVGNLSRIYPNIKEERNNVTWYFDLDGNYLGNDEEVLYQDNNAGEYNPS